MRLPLFHYATQTAYRRLRIWPGITDSVPPMGLAEADNVTSLSTSPATEPGQILLENGSCQLSNLNAA